MNIVFIIGKIITNINFEFILNGKNVSISFFEIELKNNSVIKIKAYNNLADYCYKNLEKGQIILVQGEVNSKFEIIAVKVKVLYN